MIKLALAHDVLGPAALVREAAVPGMQVCAMRIPAEELQRQLPAMLGGLLLWAHDSKNKFRLKIRLVVERLVRRWHPDPPPGGGPNGMAGWHFLQSPAFHAAPFMPQPTCDACMGPSGTSCRRQSCMQHRVCPPEP